MISQDKINDKVIEYIEKDQTPNTLILSAGAALDFLRDLQEKYKDVPRVGGESIYNLNQLAAAQYFSQAGPLDIMIMSTPLNQRWWTVQVRI